MKSTIVRFAFCLTALVSATQLFAQSHAMLRVSVPFEFTVAGQKLPAGAYSIESAGEGGTLIFHSLDTKRSLMVLSAPETAPTAAGEPSLTFHRVNGTPALTRVITDSASARSLPLAR